ncbi:MAG: GH3 auxin-responsive promoter family protein [Flavobacteriaceae bacterium]|nr:GH3 auxin-responsive promoter family protein [Flavobacteriaceae bacterium]
MSIFNTVYSWYLRARYDEVMHTMEHPHEVQQRLWEGLRDKMAYTAWGQEYDFKSIRNIYDFRNRIPVQNYDQLKPWIDRMMKGEQNVLWPSEIRWFAKSSGTTSDKSKFIPVSYENLEECHLKAARDLLSIYCASNPDTKIFSGKGLVMGGSHQLNHLHQGSYYGDLSAVLMQNLPFWVHFIRTPELSVALMPDWEVKLEKMAKQTSEQDVTNLSGVPTWTLVLIERIFQLTGKKDLHDVWPNLELYVHGGVSFTPYRERFASLFKNNVNYLETYNASEGFFGMQHGPETDLMLLLDNGTFYEFMPMSEYGKDYPETKQLYEVDTKENYALVITTNSGLCRYILGDTIKFTSLKPYKFRISGRTRHYINAFGEEIIIENAEKALVNACAKTGATIRDYTAAPIYFDENQKPTHEWLIEFEQPPENLALFTTELDNGLKEANSDYEAKRYKDLAMQLPKVQAVQAGTFQRWLKAKGKLGGQHKVPRLSNDRTVLEEVLAVM